MTISLLVYSFVLAFELHVPSPDFVLYSEQIFEIIMAALVEYRWMAITGILFGCVYGEFPCDTCLKESLMVFCL